MNRLDLLSWDERAEFAQALVLLWVNACALRIFGLKTWLRVLQKFVPSRSSGDTEKIIRSVKSAATVSPYANSCLNQSLTLWWLLQRRGMACELWFGIRRIDGELQAHAWVEHAGIILNDQGSIAHLFLPFPQRNF